ncbi:transmembrane protein 218-like isoform X2 [Homarus americanus]|uniref:transmembrane protein 218-like isoform X2 n=1 Tax=Homarus americanus TaxID=6706 RepID=UPI001C44A4A3|nr:transmembrane protein 218-like isoform X2 [Homarus americanus]XP_042224454.1 transmembrane protein 218-like isoform X2 [Homarus americanus]
MRVLGLGVGVVVLVVVWVAAAVAIIACGRSRTVAAVGVTVAAAVFSLILLLLPQHPTPHQPITEEVVIDHLFIPRVVIVLILGLSALAAFGSIIGDWTEPILAKPLKKVKL